MIKLSVIDSNVFIYRGFFYDGASLPRFLRFLDNWKNELAYLKHDYWYSRKCKTWTRKDWDLELYNDIQGISWIIIYLWVRIFWARFYKKDTNYHKYYEILDGL